MAAVTTFFGEGIPVYPTKHWAPSRAAITRNCRRAPAVYWRRRLAVAVLAVGIIVVGAQAGDALGGAPLATPERRPAAAVRTWIDVTVRPGDSLWSIVERTFPGEDPRNRVDQMADVRHGAPLVAGETVQVPR